MATVLPWIILGFVLGAATFVAGMAAPFIFIALGVKVEERRQKAATRTALDQLGEIAAKRWNRKGNRPAAED